MPRTKRRTIPPQTGEQIKTQRRTTSPGDYKKNRGGRPSTYDPLYHPYEAMKVCRLFGAGMDELANHFSIHIDTVYQWKHEYSEFSEAILKGWDDFAINVSKHSMLKRARGYSIEKRTTKVKETVNKVTGAIEELTEVTVSSHHLPGDVKAQQFILTNRDRATFPNVQANQLSGDPDNPLLGDKTPVVFYLPDNGRDSGENSD